MLRVDQAELSLERSAAATQALAKQQAPGVSNVSQPHKLCSKGTALKADEVEKVISA